MTVVPATMQITIVAMLNTPPFGISGFSVADPINRTEDCSC